MSEHWKPVPGYEGRYDVSDDGDVWSVTRRRHMTPYLAPTGYLTVGMWDGMSRKTWTVHSLVALAFLGPRLSEGMEVCHRDGDPLNNSVANLRWGTRADNTRDAVRHGTHHQSSKTHCKRGHEFTPENTQTNSAGHRRCRTCQRVHYTRSAA